MQKSMILLIMLLLLIAAFAFAAGSKEEAEAEAEGKKTITFVAYGYHSQDKIGTITEAFYKKYPDVRVNYVDLGSEDYITRLDTMIASGETVDMALAMDFPLYAQRAMNGMFLPIENYLESDGFDVQEGFGKGIQASYIDGKLYGLPYTKGGFYIFYNKDMFDKVGLSYPNAKWTWDEFQEAAKRLTSGSGAGKTYGANIHFTWTGTELETIPAKTGAWWIFEDGNTEEPNFDDPRLRKTMKMWYEMQNVDKSVISLSQLKAEKIPTRMPFAEGKAAMLFSNWWSISWFKNACFGSAEGENLMQFDLGIANIPRWDKDVPTNLNSTDMNWYFAVPNTAKHPKEGALLARFMITEMFPEMGVLSSYRNVEVEDFKKAINTYKDEEGNVHNAGYTDEQIEMIIAKDKVPISAHYGFNKQAFPEGLAVLDTIYDQERELYYSGEQSLDETIQSMQERGRQELERLN